MKSYFSICSSKFFWLKESIMHKGLNKAWRKSMSAEGSCRDELCLEKEIKLSRLLRHTAETVPFYKNYFKNRRSTINDIKLSDFPVISKNDIRGHEMEFVSTDSKLPRITWSRTSGSTGEPFRFGRSEYDCSYAALWRGLLRFGIRPGDKRALVKGVDEIPNVSFKTRIRRWIYGALNKCIVIDAHFLARSKENVIRELERLLAYRPRYIHGYANSICLLARTAEECRIDVKSLRLKAVVTESEKCHDFQREVIERVFSAPVVENYGCVEFGMIAQPAKDGVLCINEDHVIVEEMDDGAAVFTNLDELAFPLIRYKNGDDVKLGRVHKELPYLTIKAISGRKTEMIKLPNGGSLHGFIPMYPISKHSRWMRAYQIYQPNVQTLIIRIVPVEDQFPLEIKQEIISEMVGIVGSDMTIEFELCDDIPLTKRGKRLFVVSDVK